MKQKNIKSDYMVNKRNLNHFYPLRLNSLEIPIGDTQSFTTSIMTLFERSLALTGDLKKLPIIKGIYMNFSIHPDLPARMNASGVDGVRTELIMWNGTILDENHIMTHSGIVGQNALYFTAVDLSPITWDFEGGLLANNILTFRLETTYNIALAAVAMAVQSTVGNVTIEIDWRDVSSAEFKDYILENVYARE